MAFEPSAAEEYQRVANGGGAFSCEMTGGAGAYAKRRAAAIRSCAVAARKGKHVSMAAKLGLIGWQINGLAMDAVDFRPCWATGSGGLHEAIEHALAASLLKFNL